MTAINYPHHSSSTHQSHLPVSACKVQDLWECQDSVGARQWQVLRVQEIKGLCGSVKTVWVRVNGKYFVCRKSKGFVGVSKQCGCVSMASTSCAGNQRALWECQNSVGTRQWQVLRVREIKGLVVKEGVRRAGQGGQGIDRKGLEDNLQTSKGLEENLQIRAGQGGQGLLVWGLTITCKQEQAKEGRGSIVRGLTIICKRARMQP